MSIPIASCEVSVARVGANKRRCDSSGASYHQINEGGR